MITSSAPGWPLRNGSLSLSHSCVSLSHDNRARSPAISASPTLIFLFLFLAPIWICALLVYPRLFRFPTSLPCLSQILVEHSSAESHSPRVTLRNTIPAEYRTLQQEPLESTRVISKHLRFLLM